MKLLVTGGAGYIGSIVIEQAILAGHSVTTIDTLDEGHAPAVDTGATLIRADVGNRSALDMIFAAERFDAVVHLAAETTIAGSMTDPGRYFRNNAVATLTLLEAMQRHNVRRLVFSSTAAVYGEPAFVPIRETHPLSPVNAYGESKLACERMIEWFCRAHAFKAVIFRYFNAAGASEQRGEAHRHESHLIPLAISAVLGGPPFRLCGTDYPTADGTGIRDFVHVLDIADAHLTALPALDAIGFAAVNLGTGSGHSVREVLDAIGRLAGRSVPTESRPRRSGDPAILVADGRAARHTLGWTAKRSALGAVLESAWRWTLGHPHGYSA